MAHLNAKVDSMTYDKLIAGTNPAVRVASGIIKQLDTAVTYARGTLLSKDASGKLCILGTSIADGEQKFTGDASTTVFSVTAKPDKIKSVKVGDNASSDWGYDESTGKVTFGSAPATGIDNIVVTYESAHPAPDCVLCDDTPVGTTADVNAAVYVQGCFNSDGVAVANGYTLTQADKDILREKGIYFAEILA